MIHFRSVGTKIILSTIATIVFFGLIACFITYQITLRQFSDQFQQSSIGTLETSASVLEQVYTHSQLLAKSLAQDGDIVSYLAANQGQIASNSAIDALVSKYNHGQQYSAIYLLDSTGLAIVSTDKTFVGQNYGFRQYFQTAMAGRPYSDVNYGVTSKKLGYYFSYPVEDKGGQRLGVAVFKLDPQYIKDVFSRLVNSDLSGLMIVDHYGVAVESDRPERLYHSLGQLDRADSERLQSEQKYASINIKSLQYQPILGRLKSQPQKTVSVRLHDEIDGEQEEVHLTPIGNTGLYLVGEVGNQKIITTASRIATFISIMVGVAAFTAAILLAWLLSSLLSPISKLSLMANQIRQGIFPSTNPVLSGDEFSKLGDVLVSLSLAVRDKYHDLENMVQGRTQKLTQQTTALHKSQLAIQNLLEDTTRAKMAAESAANDLEKFKKAVDHTSDQIVITDHNGVVIYANPAATKLTGYSLKEMLGKKAGSKALWGGQMPLEFYQNMWQTISQDKQTFIGEIHNIRKNKQKYIAMSSISPILDSNNNVAFYVGIERDATVEREVDRMKTEFVSFASHQLRTPLSAMKWFAEMLLAGDAGKLNKEQQEFVKNIYSSNERMIELVKDLLDISRIESGRIIIDPVPTDVGQLVAGVIKEVEIKAKSKKQKIITSFNSHLPPVSLDPNLIRNVYLNLLTNAIKYTPLKGEITVIISRKGQNILSQVSDNGFGIPLDQQEQTFQKFFRASNAVQKETEGTGLGLYLVKAVIESSGGKVWFKSQEGRGTTFWFSLPIKGIPPKKGEIRLGS